MSDNNFDRLMVSEVSVLRPKRVSDGQGGFVLTFDIIDSFKGQLSPSSGTERIWNDKHDFYISHVLYTRVGYKVRREDFVRVGGSVLRVIAIREPSFKGHHYEIDVEEIQINLYQLLRVKVIQGSEANADLDIILDDQIFLSGKSIQDINVVGRVSKVIGFSASVIQASASVGFIIEEIDLSGRAESESVVDGVVRLIKDIDVSAHAVSRIESDLSVLKNMSVSVVSESIVKSDFIILGDILASVVQGSKVDGSILLDINLSSVVNQESNVVGSIVKDINFSVSVNQDSSADGLIRVVFSISGEVAEKSLIIGELDVILVMSGSVIIDSAVVARIIKDVNLSVDAVSDSAVVSNLLIDMGLSGLAVIDSVVVSNINIDLGLSSDIISDSVVVSKLDIDIAFSGSAESDSNAVLDLGVEKLLFGTMKSESAVDGNLLIDLDLSGSMISNTELSGLMVSDLLFSTVADVVSESLGSLKSEKGMNVSIEEITALDGVMFVLRVLSGSAESESVVSGDIEIFRGLSVSVFSDSAMVGEIFISRTLDVSVSMVQGSSSEGELYLDVVLSGNSEINSALSGHVSVIREELDVFFGGRFVSQDDTGILVEHDDSLNFQTDKATFEFWLEIDTLPNYDMQVMHKGGSIAVRLMMNGEVRVGKITGGIFEEIVSSEPLLLNRRLHIAGVFDGSRRKLYINGILDVDEDAVGGNTTNSTNPLTFGNLNALEGAGFLGRIWNFRIWDAERSQVQNFKTMFNPLSGREDGLMIDLAIDEGEGTFIEDNSINNNHGESLNMIWIVFDRQRFALQLRRETQFAVVAYQSGIVPSGHIMTFEGWVKWMFDVDEERRYLIEQNGSFEAFHTLAHRVEFKRYFDINDFESGITSTGCPFGVWHHFAVVYGEDDVKVYFNGILDRLSAGRISVDTVDDGSTLYIGRRLKGKMYGFRMWDIERSQSDILYHMFEPVESDEAGLIYNYQMNEGSGGTLVDSSDNNYHGDASGLEWVTWGNGDKTFEAKVVQSTMARSFYEVEIGVDTEFTDFSEYDIGVIPHDWTRRWNVGADAHWKVEEDAGAYGGKWLSHDAGIFHDWRFLSWDKIGIISDCEITTRVKTNTDGENNFTVFRGQDDLNGYLIWMQRYTGGGYLSLIRLIDGTNETIRGIFWQYEYDVWYYWRVRVEGNRIRARYWEEGEIEPTDWLFDETDNTFSAGYIGVGTHRGEPSREWDFYGVGFNGEPAPLP